MGRFTPVIFIISVVVSRVRPSFWPPFDGIRVLLGCGGVLYSLCTEMPSTAHAPGLLSTPLAREYVCQWCGKALPPLGIEPLPPAPKARALKGRAIWTLVLSHRYRRADTYPISPPARLSFLYISVPDSKSLARAAALRRLLFSPF